MSRAKGAQKSYDVRQAGQHLVDARPFYAEVTAKASDRTVEAYAIFNGWMASSTGPRLSRPASRSKRVCRLSQN
jgi:hypothetical protein